MNCRLIILVILLTALFFRSGCARTKPLPPKLRRVLCADDERPEAEALKTEQLDCGPASIAFRQDESYPAESNECGHLKAISVESKPAVDYAVRYMKHNWTFNQCNSSPGCCIAAERRDIEELK